MVRREEIEEAGALVVLGLLGLVHYVGWAIRGRPDWAKARTSYPR